MRGEEHPELLGVQCSQAGTQGDAGEGDAGWHLVSSLGAQEEVQQRVSLMCLQISCRPLGWVMTCSLHHPQQT